MTPLTLNSQRPLTHAQLMYECWAAKRTTQVVACASLLLGAKAEETPKSLHNVLREMSKVRWAGTPRELERIMASPLTHVPVPAGASKPLFHHLHASL